MKRDEVAAFAPGTLLMTKDTGYGATTRQRCGDKVRFLGMGSGGRVKYGRTREPELDPNGKRAIVVSIHESTGADVGGLRALEPREIEGEWEERNAHYLEVEARQKIAHEAEAERQRVNGEERQAMGERLAKLDVVVTWGWQATPNISLTQLAKLVELAEAGAKALRPVCECCADVLTMPPVLCETCEGSFERYADGTAYCSRHEPEEASIPVNEPEVP